MDKNNVRILFIGSKQIGLECLHAMHATVRENIVGVVTMDDSDDTRTVLDKFKLLCSSNKYSLVIAKNRKESESAIKSFSPDLCIVVGWYWLISKEVLNVPKMGFLGIHNSLLPKYRGSSCLVWSIINGEKEVGITLFSFTEGMDDGDIWAQRKIELKDSYYISDVLELLISEAKKMLSETLPLIIEGKMLPHPQKLEDSTYCARRFPDDGEIDWSLPAHKIYNYVRAQSFPYPGAYTWYKGEKLIVWKLKVLNAIYYGTPGQVAEINKDGVSVVCGDNKVVILQKIEINGRLDDAPNNIIKSFSVRFPTRPIQRDQMLYMTDSSVNHNTNNNVK